MKEEKKLVEAMGAFYTHCAEILGVGQWIEPKVILKTDRWTGEIKAQIGQRGRWAGREPGNGRYSGYGLIRMFREDCIVVNLSCGIQRVCHSPEEVYRILEEVKASQ